MRCPQARIDAATVDRTEFGQKAFGSSAQRRHDGLGRTRTSKSDRHAGTTVDGRGQSVSNPRQKCRLLGQINRPEAHDEQLKALAAVPSRLETILAAGLTGNTGSAEKLFKAVEAGKASPRLLQDRIVELQLAKLNMPNWRERAAKLTLGLPPRISALQSLFQSRRMGFASAHGDAAHGIKVFEKHCGVCHQLANKGARLDHNSTASASAASNACSRTFSIPIATSIRRFA